MPGAGSWEDQGSGILAASAWRTVEQHIPHRAPGSRPLRRGASVKTLGEWAGAIGCGALFGVLTRADGHSAQTAVVWGVASAVCVRVVLYLHR